MSCKLATKEVAKCVAPKCVRSPNLSTVCYVCRNLGSATPLRPVFI